MKIAESIKQKILLLQEVLVEIHSLKELGTEWLFGLLDFKTFRF